MGLRLTRDTVSADMLVIRFWSHLYSRGGLTTYNRYDELIPDYCSPAEEERQNSLQYATFYSIRRASCGRTIAQNKSQGSLPAISRLVCRQDPFQSFCEPPAPHIGL